MGECIEWEGKKGKEEGGKRGGKGGKRGRTISPVLLYRPLLAPAQGTTDFADRAVLLGAPFL